MAKAKLKKVDVVEDMVKKGEVLIDTIVANPEVKIEKKVEPVSPKVEVVKVVTKIRDTMVGNPEVKTNVGRVCSHCGGVLILIKQDENEKTYRCPFCERGLSVCKAAW